MLKIFSLVLLTVCVGVNSHNPCEGLHLRFVNDYADCGRYFSCLNSFPHPIKCPEGRWFSTDPIPGCYLPEAVECAECPDRGVSSFGIGSSCTEYRLCINGIPFERECASGTLFDRRDGQCVAKKNAQCDYLRCPVVGTKFVAYPSDCGRYIVCVNGVELSVEECRNGLLFDPSTQSCNRADSVQCRLSNFGSNQEALGYVDDIPTVPIVIPTAPTARPLP